jgi:FHS family L-fucose permease-like MFS transporter
MGIKFFGLGGEQEPSLEEIHDQQGRRPSAVAAMDLASRRKSVADKEITGASQITTRQSIVPVTLVTILFFLWVCRRKVLVCQLPANFSRDLHMDCWMY